MKLWRTLADLAVGVADIAAPRLCPVCGADLVAGERAMCTACLLDLPRTYLHRRDPRTAEALASFYPGFDAAAVWFAYNRRSPFASLVRTAKYADRPVLARRLGAMFAAELKAEAEADPTSGAAAFLAGIDVLLPVPMHSRKLLGRGFNQSVEIAEGFSQETGIPVGDNLVASRGHSTQTHKSRSQRIANVVGAFAVEHPDELRGLGVAVVDDVVTTGATIAACGGELLGTSSPRSLCVLALGLAQSY